MPDYIEGHPKTSINDMPIDLSPDEVLKESLHRQLSEAVDKRKHLERELAIANRVIAGCEGGLEALERKAQEEVPF